MRPSPEQPMRTLERTVAALGEAGFETGHLPLAVVICKVDAFGLSIEIQDLQPGHGNRAPREWLQLHGAGNLVRAIEHEFRDVGWFAASALGRLPRAGDMRPFTPQGAAAPLLWTLERRGVTPARRPFRASRDAQKLSAAATAADFPPISGLGWALRFVTSALPLAGFSAPSAWRCSRRSLRGAPTPRPPTPLAPRSCGGTRTPSNCRRPGGLPDARAGYTATA